MSIGKVAVRTKLQEVISDTEFLVMQPTIKGVPVRSEEEEVTFTFYRPTGCFSFRAKMSESFRKEDLVLCRVERISDIERIQRRQYYRLPVVLDVTLYEAEKNNGEDAKRWRGKSINLSEKAIAISCFSTIADGTPVTMEIKLTPTQTITQQAVVLRSHNALRSTDPNECVLLFSDQEEQDQRFLRRYIFKQQTLKRKDDEDDN